MARTGVRPSAMLARQLALRAARREALRQEQELSRGIWLIAAFSATAFFVGTVFFWWFLMRHVFIGITGDKTAIMAATFDGLGDAFAGIGLGLAIAIALHVSGGYLRSRVAQMTNEIKVAILDLELELLRWN